LHNIDQSDPGSLYEYCMVGGSVLEQPLVSMLVPLLALMSATVKVLQTVELLDARLGAE
jgi:hypothetical protein